MTPKEKAKELVDKFWGVMPSLATSKKAALMCVDELLEAPVCWFEKSLSTMDDESDTTEYWDEVKQEIHSL